MKVNEFQMKYDNDHKIYIDIKQMYEVNKIEFNTIEEINNFITDLFDLKNVVEEYSYVIAFDLKMNVLGLFQLSHGNDERCIMDSKVLFRFLLLIGANQFIVYHNHSSNFAQMSEADELITREIMMVAEFLNIKMIDHLIICKDKTISCFDEIRYKDISIEDVK